MNKSREALYRLRDAMRANDDWLNDAAKPGGAISPTGDDYNVLFDLVLDALTAAGIAHRGGGSMGSTLAGLDSEEGDEG